MSPRKPRGGRLCTSCVQQATTVNQTEQAVQALACSASAVLPASVDRELLDKLYPGAILRERHGASATRALAPVISAFSTRQEEETGLAAK